MNRNSLNRQKQLHKWTKQDGGFSKPIFKPKRQPFPKVNEPLSMIDQHRLFHGKNSLFNKK